MNSDQDSARLDPAERIGTRLGGFLLIRLLASGGMSRVFEAVDERLGRTVAIKLLDRERLGPVLRRRLLREAKILSRLNHPNICTLFAYVEGEREDALVLERIDGQTLRATFARPLPFRQRLAVAREIAAALDAAHAQGIVHRDLKPDNVMLTPDGRAKVLDFGISRAPEEILSAESTAHVSDAEESERDLLRTVEALTRAGTVVGTLLAMSPEQARGEPTTPASDMYSFGLLLQELFSRQPPYPPGLSYRDATAWVTAGRTQPAEVDDGDLAALIADLKEMSPVARPTAAAASARLDRIAGKKARRLRWAAAAVIATAAIAGVGAYLQAVGTERNRALAAERSARQALEEAEAARADQRTVLDFVVGLFEVSDPGSARGRSISARELLDAAALEVSSDPTLSPSTRGRLEETTGRIYRNLGLYPEARRLLENSLAVREATFGRDHPQTISSLFELATLDQFEHRPEAEARLREVLEVRERLLGPDHLDVATTLNRLAVALGSSGRLVEARPLIERALSIRTAELGEGDTLTVATMSNLGIVLAQTGEPQRAQELFERALALREKILPPDHPDLAVQREALAAMYGNSGQPEKSAQVRLQALPVLEKALGPEHPMTLLSKSNLATVYLELGRTTEAEVLAREALAARLRTLGPDHPDVAITLELVGDLAAASGDPTEARRAFERSLAISVASYPTGHPSLARLRQKLAGLDDPDQATGKKR